jgi:hypothetical protein
LVAKACTSGAIGSLSHEIIPWYESQELATVAGHHRPRQIAHPGRYSLPLPTPLQDSLKLAQATVKPRDHVDLTIHWGFHQRK